MGGRPRRLRPAVAVAVAVRRAPPARSRTPISWPSTQDELADGAAISGTGVYGLQGSLLVRAAASAGSGGSDEGIVLITSKTFEQAGAFTINVPKDRPKVVLQIVEDTDDGKPSAGERMGIPVGGPVTVESAVSGVTLEVGVFPQMGAADSRGAELNGPPEGPANPSAPVGEGAAPGVPGGEGAAPPLPAGEGAEAPAPADGAAPAAPEGAPPAEGAPDGAEAPPAGE